MAQQSSQSAAAFPASTNIVTAAMAAHGPGEDPLLGRTLLDRYRIVKKLGEGGMGSVYSATHVALEKSVAIKILHGEYARKPDLVERFMQEAKAASRINHENVIDISDYGVTEEGLVFFAMEMLKGGDLHELIARTRLDGEVLPWERSRPIFLQICSALAAAHAHGIVHRDLKPENIFLIEFLGRPDFVKLLDFGIAKLAENDGGERKLTRTGMLFGTPEYMSPEQARGDKVDHRVDIYAMACILFQLLTGRVPFEADNFMGVLSMHLTEPPPQIPAATLQRCGAPPQVAEIVARGLCKNREERWQSIEAMAQAVRALSGPAHRGHPGTLDHPGADAIAIAVPARINTPWTGTLEVPATVAVRSGRRKAPIIAATGLLVAAVAAAGALIVRRSTSVDPVPAGADRAIVGSPTAVPSAGAVREPQPVTDPVVPASPSLAPLPAPAPDKVKITFRLPKGSMLYDPDGKSVADARRQSKVVDLELRGSNETVQYVARGKGMREREINVIPDRDAVVEVALEAISALPRDRAGASGPQTSPSGGGSSGSGNGPAQPATPAAGEPPPEDPDPGIEPILKPFDGGGSAAP